MSRADVAPTVLSPRGRVAVLVASFPGSGGVGQPTRLPADLTRLPGAHPGSARATHP